MEAWFLGFIRWKDEYRWIGGDEKEDATPKKRKNKAAHNRMRTTQTKDNRLVITMKILWV
jgi:hypothetical protein